MNKISLSFYFIPISKLSNQYSHLFGSRYILWPLFGYYYLAKKISHPLNNHFLLKKNPYNKQMMQSNIQKFPHFLKPFVKPPFRNLKLQ
jgi:hypothetical protein